MKGDQSKLADQQKLAVQQDSADAAFIAELAPDTDTVHVNFACATIDSIGLTASGQTAWNILRRRNNPIIWAVAQNAQAVTINSIKGKSGSLPIDTVPGEPHGGAPGTMYKAKVNSNAGGPPPFPGLHTDKSYAYEIDVTCTSGAKSTRLVIDPELIVRRP
jgi:hypothetical protein